MTGLQNQNMNTILRRLSQTDQKPAEKAAGQKDRTKHDDYDDDYDDDDYDDGDDDDSTDENVNEAMEQLLQENNEPEPEEVNEPEPKEVTGAFITSFGKIDKTEALSIVNELADRSLNHALTATTTSITTGNNETETFLNSRYNSTRFYGIMIDTGASTQSIAGYGQYKAYSGPDPHPDLDPDPCGVEECLLIYLALVLILDPSR